MNLPLFRVQDDPGPDFSQLLRRSGFAPSEIDAAEHGLTEFTERIVAYMLKACREAMIDQGLIPGGERCSVELDHEDRDKDTPLPELLDQMRASLLIFTREGHCSFSLLRGSAAPNCSETAWGNIWRTRD